jgi:tellurite resistance protein TehA-like permease
VLADATGAWLLPFVAPMVSATTGAGLVAHAPAGQARLDLLIILYALFGLSLLPTLLTLAVVWARLLLHGPGPAERAPALWVVLGPLGQSITAASLLGAAAARAVDGPAAEALRAFGLVYGLIVWGFAVLWLALAIVLTRHHATRDGVPFTAAWWSFVFPVGTLVTGTSELAVRTGSEALRAAAIALFLMLLAAWATTAARSGAAALDLGLRGPRPA